MISLHCEVLLYDNIITLAVLLQHIDPIASGSNNKTIYDKGRKQPMVTVTQ